MLEVNLVIRFTKIFSRVGTKPFFGDYYDFFMPMNNLLAEK